jgi:hypothetical protein
MRLLNKTLVFFHRYLGIPLSLLVVLWFASGIVMIYAGGMPAIEPETRLARMPDLDTGKVQLTLAEAAEKAGFDASAGWDGPRVTMLTVMGRPAYRFGTAPTVFADTGEMLESIDRNQARTVAARFLDLPEDKIRFVRTLSEPDQWTLSQGRAMPEYKFAASDGRGSEVYVQPRLAEVVMHTTRQSRFFAWIGVIPHWLYFAPLRVHQPLWYRIVVWTSTLATGLAAIGLVLAVTKLRRTKPFRLSKAIPYAGWMRWHYITGAIFGIFSLTWAFSGLLSMEPYAWTNAEGLALPRDTFSGGAMDFAAFGRVEPPVWTRALDGRPIREIAFARIQDQPFYIVRPAPAGGDASQRERLHQPYNAPNRAEADRLLVAAGTMTVRDQPFGEDTLLARLAAALPNVKITEHTLLTDYDDYYYSRGSLAPLPVLRVKFDDPMQTWAYIDPMLSQPLAIVHRLNRLERWLFNGLHDLDFSFLYNSRPLWDIVMLVLLTGGLVSSALGMWLGLARMKRGAMRNARALGKPRETSPEAAE